MKNLLSVLAISFTLLFSSCGYTTPPTDLMKIQKDYPNSVIYAPSLNNYIVVDSLNTVWSISMTYNGDYNYVIRVK